jgi:ubiquitin-like protein Pup
MEQLASDDAAAQEHITVDEIDDLLDEIDSVLEENALEVVRCFVQRGGQ